MLRKKSSKNRVFVIDTNQPGALELIAVMKTIDGTVVTSTKGRKNLVKISMRQAKPARKSYLSRKRSQGITLGSKKDKSGKLVARQSCAVMVK